MDAKQRYEMWLGSDQVDDVTKQELVNIKDNEAEIEDRFYTNLEFGTGGLRGVMGAGTNRMNIYTVRMEHRELLTTWRRSEYQSRRQL